MPVIGPVFMRGRRQRNSEPALEFLVPGFDRFGMAEVIDHDPARLIAQPVNLWAQMDLAEDPRRLRSGERMEYELAKVALVCAHVLNTVALVMFVHSAFAEIVKCRNKAVVRVPRKSERETVRMLPLVSRDGHIVREASVMTNAGHNEIGPLFETVSEVVLTFDRDLSAAERGDAVGE